MQHRIDRLVRKRSITPEKAKETIEKVDQGRENYVKKYTGSSRYDTRNYDLVINMDDHTEDEALEIILKYIK
jgi:cytidylate kinase